jgi:tryptophan 2,3-dioxygenase
MGGSADETEHPHTYASYLRLERLLSSQEPQSDSRDELLFITIHQVKEL